MFALSYKTAGDSPSRGKPRVYLCCHPDEQKTYLEPISKEVLSKQTCAIWYAQDPHAPRDEAFWSDLEQMQLLLLPVTTRL